MVDLLVSHHTCTHLDAHLTIGLQRVHHFIIHASPCCRSVAFLLLSSQKRRLQPLLHALVDRASIWARLQFEWTPINDSACHLQLIDVLLGKHCGRSCHDDLEQHLQRRNEHPPCGPQRVAKHAAVFPKRVPRRLLSMRVVASKSHILPCHFSQMGPGPYVYSAVASCSLHGCCDLDILGANKFRQCSR